MYENVTINIGTALVLGQIASELLHKVEKNDKNEPVLVDRELPFKLRYRLNRNMTMLEKDAEWFNSQRLLALARLGKPSEDGKSVVITDPENEKLFKEEVGKLIDTEVTHSIMRLDPEDLQTISDIDLTIGREPMKLFIAYMTEDQQLIDEINFHMEINIKKEEPKAEPKKEELVADTAVVAEKPAKKTTAKKTTTTKKTTTKKTTTTKKAK